MMAAKYMRILAEDSIDLTETASGPKVVSEVDETQHSECFYGIRRAVAWDEEG